MLIEMLRIVWSLWEELKTFVRNPVPEITIRSFYSSIDAVGKELRFYTGICGRREPMQGVPIWFEGSDIRLKKIRVKI